MAALYYDDECRFCRDLLRRFGRTLARRRFTFVPLQAPDAARLLGVSDEHLLDEMRLRLENGTVLVVPPRSSRSRGESGGPGRCGRSVACRVRWFLCARSIDRWPAIAIA
jgi:hypothetical protein